MLTLMMTAVLAQAWMDEPVKDPVGPLISGRYEEVPAHGGPGCVGAAFAHSLEIRVLGAPPHARSANIGEMSYWLGSADNERDGFTVAGQPERIAGAGADGSWRVRLRGGRINTVGLYQDGISSGQLTGRFEVELEVLPDDRLRILSLELASFRGSEAVAVITDGRRADGSELRPFERCSDAQVRR